MPVTDFDFLPGRWDIANRRLVAPVDPACDEWEEFPAVSEARAILGGIGNTDTFTRADTGFRGYSLRLYEPEQDLWRIWWGSTTRPGQRGGGCGGPRGGGGDGGPRRSKAGSPRPTAGASSATTCSRAWRSACASTGRRSRRRAPTGSSSSPSTAARPGSRTGSWSSRAGRDPTPPKLCGVSRQPTHLGIDYDKRLMLFAGRSSPGLAEHIGRRLRVGVGPVQQETWANGE